MKSRWVQVFFVLMIFPSVCRAQFYTVGDNPASVRWYRTETPNYKIIYPEGLDSLAMVYGRTLETYRHAVGRSAGFDPGQNTRGKLPVIMHAFNARSNGSVTWAPKRLDFFVSPQAYGSEPMPWPDMLAIHEQRHSAQMQAGLSGVFRPFNWIFGEMFNGLVAGVWPYKELLEGDAVVAETALSRSGRGRTADFLNYWMIAFDNGDIRNWHKWRLGSQRNYAPSYYTAGYILFGGMRFRYGYTGVTADYFHHIARKPWDVRALTHVVKAGTGADLKTAYREIADTLTVLWRQEIEARKPFIPSEQISKTPSRYTEYAHSAFAGNDLYVIKSSMTRPAELVTVDTLGRERHFKSFADRNGTLCYVPRLHRLYWSEDIPDERWGQKVDSHIRYCDIETGRRRSLTRKGRMFFPYPSPDETMISAAEYFDDGRTGITIVDIFDGHRISGRYAPDTVQFVENVWIKDTIYATGISAGGYGIYSIRNSGGEFSGDWRTVLAPQPVQICNFGGEGDELHFACDRTGVKEFYVFTPADGVLVRKTSTRYGADDFVFDNDGKYLYYSLKGHSGNLLSRTPADSLTDSHEDFNIIHAYPMADELTRQEKALAAADTVSAGGPDFTFTGPARYRKFPHLMKIHSWAPVYFNIDNLMNLSGEHYYDLLSLGVAALSQNDLGTAVSSFGYSAHKDPYDPRKWRHSGHFKFTYSGLYPVIEASVDFNDRSARITGLGVQYLNGEPAYLFSRSRDSGKPYVSGSLSAYIPFNFSRGGWTTGLIPRISYNLTNDVFHTSLYWFDSYDGLGDSRFLIARNPGRGIIRQRIVGSVRFYIRRPVAESGVFPRYGFGAETGGVFYPALQKYYSPAVYANIYGYLPGVIPQHGLYLKALFQSTVRGKGVFRSTIVDIRPRGFAQNEVLQTFLAGNSENSVKFSAEYGIPVYVGDVSAWGSFLYLRRLTVNPHFDWAMFGTGVSGAAPGGLFSAGITVAADFRALFWLSLPFDIGITYSYNGGPSFNSIRASGAPLNRHFVGPVFSVQFR